MSKGKGWKTPSKQITRANTKLLNLKAIWVGTGDAESLLQVVEMIGVRTPHNESQHQFAKRFTSSSQTL